MFSSAQSKKQRTCRIVPVFYKIRKDLQLLETEYHWKRELFEIWLFGRCGWSNIFRNRTNSVLVGHNHICNEEVCLT